MLENKKLIYIEQAVMPVEDDMLSADLQASLNDQLYNLGEMAFCCWHVPWVDVRLLERAKK